MKQARASKYFLLSLVLFLFVALLPVSALAAERVELTFTIWLEPPMMEKYVKFANDYMKERYPNVDVVGITTFGTNENYNSKVLVSTTAGAGPDIYFFNLANFNTEWVASYNLMLPIDDLLDAAPELKADLAPALLDAWRYQGKLYGLPTTIGQYAVYYNRDHFNEAGLGRPADDWTIQGEFADNIRKLLRVDNNGVATRHGLQLQNNLNGRFMNYVLSEGGHVIDEEVSRARINEPEFVETVDRFRHLYTTGQVDYGSTGNAYNGFVAGNTSMFYSGIFYQSRVDEFSDFDWGVVRAPMGAAGRQTVANTNAWVVNPQSKHVDLAWELAKAFSSPEFARAALVEGMEFPVSLSGLNEYYFETLPDNLSREEGQIWIEAINYIRPFPKHELMPDIWRVATAAFRNAVTGKEDPRNAMEAAAAQINGLISQ